MVQDAYGTAVSIAPIVAGSVDSEFTKGLADLRGYVVEGLVDYDISEYYTGALNTGKPYITDPYPYVVDGKDTYLCSISIPINRDGAMVGVCGVDLDLSSFMEAMNADMRFRCEGVMIGDTGRYWIWNL